MSLPDVLALVGAGAVAIGGTVGAIAGGPGWRGAIDDAQRGSFCGLWLGTFVALVGFVATRVN